MVFEALSRGRLIQLLDSTRITTLSCPSSFALGATLRGTRISGSLLNWSSNGKLGTGTV